MENDGTFLGMNGGRRVYTPDNAKHIFVAGTTGSGKTVALGNYIKRALDCNYPLLLVDGKGDVGEGSMLDIVRKLNPPNRKLYIVNLTNPQQSDYYNPFRETAPTIAKDMLVNLTNWTEEHYKLNAERYLQRLVMLLCKAEMPLSLKNIVRNMSANRFTELSAELLKTEKIDKDDHLDNIEIVKTSGKVSENSVARFSLIAESEIGHIFAENGIDIYSALRERATIIFVLNPLIYPGLSPLLGRLETYQEEERLRPLFNEVYAKAKQNNPELADYNIDIYIMDSMAVNACAVGLRTVAVTKGAVKTFSDEQLKAIIAHEIAHILHADTFAKIKIMIGNGIFTLCILTAKLVWWLIGRVPAFRTPMNNVSMIFDFIVMVFLFPMQIAMAVNDRYAENLADNYAFEIGYGEGMVEALYLLEEMSLQGGGSIIEKMLASHPRVTYRIMLAENRLGICWKED
ncbi:MAG: M48 family metalloprotease [Oscillospiraceae bacterium]|jgi:Zn-dependent protease with chaperone function|nr:M48 family metalloprotease [Oscillospiraceae bacterium]